MENFTQSEALYSSFYRQKFGIYTGFSRQDQHTLIHRKTNTLYFGETSPLDLPPEELAYFAALRNGDLKELLIRYANITSFRLSTELRKSTKAASLDSEQEHDEQSAIERLVVSPQSIDIRQFSGKEITYTNNSLVAKYFAPTLPHYLNHRENLPIHSFTDSHKTQANLRAWKNFFMDRNEPFKKFFSQSLEAYIDFEAFKESAYVLGATKSGKTEFLKVLIHQLIALKMPRNPKLSGLILDPHGDLSEQVSKWRECYNNDRVILFDPTAKEGMTPSIDIFSVPSKDNHTINLYASEFADAFAEAIGGDLSTNMSVVLSSCLDVLYRRDNSSMYDLQRFMIEGEGDDLIQLGKQSPNKAISEFFRSAFELPKYKTTKEALYTKLQTLRSAEVFTRLLNPKGTLNLEKELNSGKLIIVNLSRGAMSREVSHVFGRLLVAMVKSIGFRREKIPQKDRPETYVFIDEFQNFVGDSIEEVLTETRKYGLHLVLAHQLLGQRMNAKLQKAILANTAVKIVGKNDIESLKAMSVRLGAELEELQQLTTGKFCAHVKSGKKPTKPFLFYSPTHLLGDKNQMSPQEWEETKARGWIGYRSNRTLDRVYNTQNSPVDEPHDLTESKSTIGDPKASIGANKPRFDI